MGRPRKPTSASALNPDQWAELAIAYADGHARRVRAKFERGGRIRWADWEDMRSEFRETAYKALKDVCRLAPPGLRSPQAYILSLLRLKLRGVFAEICSRHVRDRHELLVLDAVELRLLRAEVNAATNAAFTEDGIGIG